MLRFILLAATGRDEAAKITRRKIDGGVSPVSSGRKNRDKSNKDFELPLSKATAGLLDAIPKIEGKTGWVFTHDGKRAIGALFTRPSAR